MRRAPGYIGVPRDGGNLEQIKVQSAPGAARLDSLSSTVYMTSAVGAGGPDLTPGRTIGLRWWDNDPTADSSPWSYSSGVSGWFLDSNSLYMYCNIRLAGGTNLVLQSESRVYGLNAIVVTRTAGGALRASMNGSPVKLLAAAPAIVAGDAAAREYLGRANPAVGTFTAAKVMPVDWMALTREASDAELQAWSDTGTLDRFHWPAALLGDVALSLRGCAEDLAGGQIVPRVGASRVLTATGAVTKTTLEAEYVYTPSKSIFLDGLQTIDATKRAAFQRLRVTTTAQRLAVKVVTQDQARLASWLNYQGAGLLKAGAWVEFLKNKNGTGNLPPTLDCHDLGAGSKVVDITEGIRVVTLAGPPYGAVGFVVSEVRAPQSTPLTFTKKSTPAALIYVVGDSILEGDKTTVPQNNAWPNIARRNGASLISDASGSSSWFSWYNDPTARAAAVERIATMVAGVASPIVAFDLGTNDYGLAPWGGVWANLTACVNATLTAVRARLPGATIIVKTPILRSPDGTCNLCRAAIVAGCVGVSGVIVINGETWTVTLSGDGLHPVDAGQIQMEAQWRPNLAY